MSESESDSDADGHMQYNSSRDSSGRMGGQSDRKAAKGDSSKQTETFSLDADSVATLIVTVLFAPGAAFQDWEGSKPFKGVLRLYESRNEDVVKENLIALASHAIPLLTCALSTYTTSLTLLSSTLYT
eukprot:2075-Heterococcus_DN1.PRE.2